MRRQAETVIAPGNNEPKKANRSRGGKTVQQFTMQQDCTSKKGKIRGRRVAQKVSRGRVNW